MDPTASLTNTLDLLAGNQGDTEDTREEMAQGLRDLADWVEKGGFLPDMSEVFLRVLR